MEDKEGNLKWLSKIQHIKCYELFWIKYILDNLTKYLIKNEYIGFSIQLFSVQHFAQQKKTWQNCNSKKIFVHARFFTWHQKDSVIIWSVEDKIFQHKCILLSHTSNRPSYVFVIPLTRLTTYRMKVPHLPDILFSTCYA